MKISIISFNLFLKEYQIFDNFFFLSGLQFLNLFFFHEAEGKSYRRNLLIPDFGNNWEDFAIAFIIGYPETTVTGWSKLPVNSGMFRFGTALAKNSLKISRSFFVIKTRKLKSETHFGSKPLGKN